jgi:hypothetical protein
MEPCIFFAVEKQLEQPIPPDEKAAFKTYLAIVVAAMLDDTSEEQTCDLCKRAQPVFVGGFDNSILRMQDSHLPVFLKQVKADFLAHQDYFRVLRVNSRFV